MRLKFWSGLKEVNGESRGHPISPVKYNIYFHCSENIAFYIFTAVKYSFFKICIISNQYFSLFHYLVYNEKNITLSGIYYKWGYNIWAWCHSDFCCCCFCYKPRPKSEKIPVNQLIKKSSLSIIIIDLIAPTPAVIYHRFYDWFSTSRNTPVLVYASDLKYMWGKVFNTT